MGRSLKKGPYINQKILKKVKQIQDQGKAGKTVLKVYDRSCTITPEMIGLKIAVHMGNGFQVVLINEQMVGHKLGEFAPTTRFKGHAKKGKLAKVYASTGRYLKDERVEIIK